MTNPTKKKRVNKQRIALAIGAAAVIGGLAWLWAGVGDAPSTPPAAPTAKLEATDDAGTRQEIAAAQRAAREKIAAREKVAPPAQIAARRPVAKPVMPEHPPPVGLPPTATKLPGQPDQRMPTPRGSYD